ncbi:phosphatidylinositol glycan class B [Lewinella aquimaris]|uniref:Phosphatidylinositol glycan class B n=1 Tax=Neolewinella aquimaris TaxID=1835722 RepID=A0A840DX60_9BACT|nr:hypothetical protein [Neolewinella aquimaris]MBB4077804.1 phosphatidylinositol glycan class B [Neolewinella aquimaris]
MNKLYVILAGLLFVVTAVFSTGHHQGDEHFQILEFAGYKLGMVETDDLPWEFDDRMRPALQPAIAYVVYRIVGLAGEPNPFTVALLLRLLSGAFTLVVALLLYDRYGRRMSLEVRPWFVLLLLFNWCAYYNGVRFSSENWSGLTAVLGFLAYPLARPTGFHRFTGRGGYSAFVAGICFGLAFLFRYQMGLLIAGFGLWLVVVERERWQNIAVVILGGLTALLLTYPLSYWLYGEWTLPAWNYLTANLIEGKAATYGTRPWYAYPILVFLRGIPPVSLVYLAGAFAFFWYFRRDPVSWMVVAFMVAHSLLARKDVRFLFPLIPLLPVLVAGAATEWQRRRGTAVWRKKWVKGLVAVAWVTNLLLLAIVLTRPAASEIAPAAFVYDSYAEGATLVGPDREILVAEGSTGRYYLRSSHQLALLSSKDHGTCGPAPCLFVTNTREVPSPPGDAVLVFTDRPRWIDAVNVGGWADRQKWWYIYELK